MPFASRSAVVLSRCRPARLLPWSVAVVLVCALGAGAQAPRRSTVIDASALLRDLQVLSADDMQGRLIGSGGGIKARDYLVERFRSVGLQPFGSSFVQPFSFAVAARSGPVEYHGANVVGRIAGARQAGRYLVVSAHYDHLGVRGGRIYNGADDNASGTAALLAIARYFVAHQPDCSIIVAAFDGEEQGLRGSRAFVQRPPVDISAIAIDLNLDMIGRDPNDKLFAVGTFLNPFLKPYVERVARTAPVHLLPGHDNPAQKGVEDWTKDSDHWSFQQAKIPAIYLGDEDFAEHHQPTDDYETMTPNFFIGATETAIAVLSEFDRNIESIDQRR
jgi:peptidase M28-like protein